MPLSNNLQRRYNGVYYLRVFIPAALVPQFGRKEVTHSLRTTCHSHAERFAITMRSRIYGLIDMAENNSKLGKDELRQMAKRLFDRTVEEAEVPFLKQQFKPKEKEHWGDEYQDMINRVGHSLEGNLFNSPDTKEIMDELLKSEGLALDPDSHQYRQVAEVALKATIEALKMQQQRLLGKFDPQPNSDVLPTAGEPPKPATKTDNAVSFDELVEKFLAENSKTWKLSTLNKYVEGLALCGDILGQNIQAASIDKGSVRSIKEVLSVLPPNRTKTHPDLSLDKVIEIAKRADGPKISPSTCNAYLTALSSLMTWACKQGYAETNPVSGMMFPDPVRPKDKRNPFSVDHLNAIFACPTFTGMKTDHHWKDKGTVINKNERYWIPLIALFSGMRLGEIVALKPNDFKVQDGINYLTISEAKTEAGVRKLPVHPKLIEARLMVYIDGIDPDNLLFSNTSSDAFGKHFARQLDSIGITDKKLVFHSFRHTFTDALRAAKVTEPIIKSLIGHSDGSVTSQYGSGYPLEVLYGDLKRINYHGVILP